MYIFIVLNNFTCNGASVIDIDVIMQVLTSVQYLIGVLRKVCTYDLCAAHKNKKTEDSTQVIVAKRHRTDFYSSVNALLISDAWVGAYYSGTQYAWFYSNVPVSISYWYNGYPGAPDYYPETFIGNPSDYDNSLVRKSAQSLYQTGY
jgi:hypothetical protein